MNYAWKRIVSYVISGLIPFMVFVIMNLLYKDFVASALVAFISVFLCVFIGRALTAHPYINMLESRGLVVFGINSSGIIQPYTAAVNLPYLDLMKKNPLRTIFDRKIAFYLMRPKRAELSENEEHVLMTVPKPKHTAINYSMQGTPVFLYNEKLNSFITKEFLSENENSIMTEHLTLVLLDQVRSFRKSVQDLTRHVVDQFAPNKFWGILKNPWVMAMIIIVVMVLVVMLVLPQLPKMLGYASSAASSIQGVPVAKKAGAAALHAIAGTWL